MTLCLSQLEEQARAVSRAIGTRASGCSLEIPLRIQSEANQREHWATKAKRVRKHRRSAAWALQATWPLLNDARPALPCVVTLTRLAPRQLDDDNLAGGFKAVRDGVADWLGIDDRDPRVTWRYAQERAKGYACRIEIEEGGQ